MNTIIKEKFDSYEKAMEGGIEEPVECDKCGKYCDVGYTISHLEDDGDGFIYICDDCNENVVKDEMTAKEAIEKVLDECWEINQEFLEKEGIDKKEDLLGYLENLSGGEYEDMHWYAGYIAGINKKTIEE